MLRVSVLSTALALGLTIAIVGKSDPAAGAPACTAQASSPTSAVRETRAGRMRLILTRGGWFRCSASRRALRATHGVAYLHADGRIEIPYVSGQTYRRTEPGKRYRIAYTEGGQSCPTAPESPEATITAVFTRTKVSVNGRTLATKESARVPIAKLCPDYPGS